MLKTFGKASLMFRLGSRVFVCLRNDHLDSGLRDRIRPFVFGSFACWCDKRPAS